MMNKWMRPWLVRTSQSEAQKILGQKLWAFVSRGLARGKEGKWPLKETSREVESTQAAL